MPRLPAPTLVGAMLSDATRVRGSVAVFADAAGDICLAHADLVAQARRLAGGLAALGLAAGDIVAVQMPTRPATMIVHAALAWAGMVVLPIIHIYGDAELAFILKESGARAIITPHDWRAVDFAGRRAWLAETFPHVIRIVDGVAEAGEVALDSLLSHPPHPAPVAVASDDPAMLIYTSGTTSQPKGVRHSHASLLAELAVDAAARGQLLTLAPWPPGHVAGVLGLLRFAAMGQPSVYLDAWDGHMAARLIEQYRVEASSGTPFHITTLLDAAAADGRDISSLRDYMAGATMIPPALIDRCEALGLATYRCYGLSEHPTISSGSPTDPLAKRLGSDGRLNPGVEVRIVDDDGRDLPPGQPGEIWSRGPDRFIGYHDSSRDAEAFTPDGWPNGHNRPQEGYHHPWRREHRQSRGGGYIVADARCARGGGGRRAGCGAGRAGGRLHPCRCGSGDHPCHYRGAFCEKPRGAPENARGAAAGGRSAPQHRRQGAESALARDAGSGRRFVAESETE